MFINTYLISTCYRVKGGGGGKSGLDSGFYFRGASFIGEVSWDCLGIKRVQGSAQYGVPRESFPEALGN